MVAHAENVSVPRKPRKPGLSIPLFTRIRAQNLYVNQLASASVVSAATGLTTKQVYDLADREGWTKLRNETKRRATEDVNARTQANIDELVRHVADDTAELSLGTLAKAKKTLERDDEFAAKDLQAYSVAAKNFVGLYRQAKNLDVAQESATHQTLVFMGDFVRSGDGDTAAKEPVNVTPSADSTAAAIDVTASESASDVVPSDPAP